MQRIEYRRENNSLPDGPWNDEPDKIQWPDKDTGLPCLIVRGPLGNLCGYVGVTQYHPAYGANYDDVTADVHGGLTFVGRCVDGDEAETICHKPEPGESDNVWWLGFDCAHAYDLVPLSPHVLRGVKEEYRDVAYVTEECRQLAAQLKAME